MDRRWWWGAGALGAAAVLVGVAPAVAEPAAAAERFVCRSFAYDPHEVPEIDTHDGASAIGKWVMEREDRGWRVTSVEPQVVVKATGALEAWAHVCVAPVR